MITFITFGSDNKYIGARNRLINQAQNLNMFDNIKLYTDIDLKNDNEFWEQHKDFIQNNMKGYGYWLWKPYIIKKTMENMNENDILLYLDSGCELGEVKKSNIITFLNYVKTDYIIGSLAKLEKEWTKMDLIKYLDVYDSKYTETMQHQAGALMINVCKKTKDLVNEWYNIGCNYHYIDDSPSFLKNNEYFKEHRHDQSIFSLLTKKHNIFSKHDIHECVYYIRNRTGVSKVG